MAFLGTTILPAVLRGPHQALTHGPVSCTAATGSSDQPAGEREEGALDTAGSTTNSNTIATSAVAEDAVVRCLAWAAAQSVTWPPQAKVGMVATGGAFAKACGDGKLHAL